MYKTLDFCFGDNKDTINFKDFQRINEEIASDMLLSVLNLFREKLPCSENFWRYKRNYELHMMSQSSSVHSNNQGDSKSKEGSAHDQQKHTSHLSFAS